MIEFSEAQLLGWLSGFLLPFFRVLGIFTAAPLLSARAFPARIRIGLAFVIAIVAAPLARTPAPAFDDPAIWTLLAAEIMIGLAIGLVARMILSAVDLAGETIGLQMGLSFAGFFDPASGSNSNAVGRLLGTLSLAAFVAADGPALLIAATVQSIETVPAGRVGADYLARIDIAGDRDDRVRARHPDRASVHGAAAVREPRARRRSPGSRRSSTSSRSASRSRSAAGLVLLAIGLPLMAQPFARIHHQILSHVGY